MAGTLRHQLDANGDPITNTLGQCPLPHFFAPSGAFKVGKVLNRFTAVAGDTTYIVKLVIVAKHPSHLLGFSQFDVQLRWRASYDLGFVKKLARP